MSSFPTLTRYLDQKFKDAALCAAVQVEGVGVPYYLYAQYLCNWRADPKYQTELEQILAFSATWYPALVGSTPNAWVDGKIGGQLKPNLFSLLFSPFDAGCSFRLAGVLPLTRLHAMLWRLNPPVSIPYDPSSDSAVESFLRFYYASDRQWSTPLCDQEREWLQKAGLAGPRVGLPKIENYASLSVKPEMKFGMTHLGFPKAEFGIGEVSRSVVLSLDAVGTPNEVVDLYRYHGHPGRDLTVEKRITQDASYPVTFLNAPIHYPSVLLQQSMTTDFFLNRYFVGYPPWELDRWNLDFYYRFYDEIWAPSRFIQEIFQRGVKNEIPLMPYPVHLPEFEKKPRSYFGLPEDRFLFFSAFDFNSKIQRKNPIGSVRSFKKAFPDRQDVGFVIKAMYASETDPDWKAFLSEIGDDPRFHVINRVYDRSDVFALLNVIDCFVSLHRSEGFGLVMAESMLLEKPVIATHYSGNRDFCGEQWAFPVGYRLIPVQPHEYPFSEGARWADPSVDEAAERMREVFAGGENVHKRVQAAKINVHEQYGLEACGRRFTARLRQLYR